MDKTGIRVEFEYLKPKPSKHMPKLDPNQTKPNLNFIFGQAQNRVYRMHPTVGFKAVRCMVSNRSSDHHFLWHLIKHSATSNELVASTCSSLALGRPMTLQMHAYLLLILK